MPASAAWRRFFATIVLVLASTLAFTVVTAGSADAVRTMRERKIHHGLQVALNHRGDPYVYGAEGPHRFDCSGLTMFSYGKAGLYLPRSAADQYRFVRHIPKRNLHRGDLMFFHSGGSVYHVAIFLRRIHGHVWLLHAPHTGTVVQRDPVWTRSWWAGTLRHRPGA
jgi:cell wall-associated NlpC family hydrolase